MNFQLKRCVKYLKLAQVGTISGLKPKDGTGQNQKI